MSCRISAVLVSFLVLQWLSLVKASHFRHGTIMWAPADSFSNTVHFSFRLAFRRTAGSGYHCDQTTISQGSPIQGAGGNWEAKCVNATNPNCSSSTKIADTAFYCTDYSITEDWSMGENNFTYTFPSFEQEWSVSFFGCCWISLSRYSGGHWLVTTGINLTRRADNGKINSSPVSRSAAIIRFQEGCNQSVRIPVEDPDGDVVKCRFANHSESYKYSDSFPYGVLDEESCILKYEGANGSAGTYAVTLILEDFLAGTTNFDSVRPFSAVGLQFLVMITGQSGSCNDIPVFGASTPKDRECSEVHVGSEFTTVIVVQAAGISKHIVEIITSSPAGMHLTPLSFHGGFFYSNVTWYPSQSQVGQQVFCFKAMDSAGLESEMRCVTILVGLDKTPRVIIDSRIPKNPISKSGPGFVQFSIQFDRVIKKPHTSSFIRLVHVPSGHTVYKVDTLSQYVILDSNGTTLYFGMPNAAFSMKGTYAILIDEGAVVGQGCSYDGPLTPGITSVNDWNFSVQGICPLGSYLAPPTFTNCVDIDECAVCSSSSTTSAASVYHIGTPVASYFQGLATPSDFMLHLPANCEQTCINTQGSYSCSCVSGYRLNSNGKSCTDIDECANNKGGCSHQCFNIPGSFYCGCPDGFDISSNNLTCDDPSVSIACNPNSMTLALEKKKYHFLESSLLHLNYESCRATENSTHLLISSPLNDCGILVEETEEFLVFQNQMKAETLIIDNITRHHDVNMHFSCSYSRKTLQSQGFKPRDISFLNETGYGIFIFKMDFYVDSSFSTPHDDKDYPLVVALNDYVYVKYSVESSADLVIMAENCKATKDGNYYSWPQYTIIKNGCPQDPTLDYNYDPNRSFQQFKIKSFRFPKDYETVYIHCELLACYRYSKNSRCNRGCLTGSNTRKKRDVSQDEVVHGESTSKIILAQGPLVIKERQAPKVSTGSGHSKQSAGLIGGVVVACVFGVIALVAFAVFYMKYLKARQLMGRNGPGNQYANRNEELGQTNPCVYNSSVEI